MSTLWQGAEGDDVVVPLTEAEADTLPSFGAVAMVLEALVHDADRELVELRRHRTEINDRIKELLDERERLKRAVRVMGPRGSVPDPKPDPDPDQEEDDDDDGAE